MRAPTQMNDENSPTDLVSMLSDPASKMSAQERKLAATVLEDVAFATNASISEIAERAGVSAPTVTRFCRHVGCSSYSDFKVQLAKSSYVGLRYLQPGMVTRTPEEVAEDIVTKAQNALFEMHRQLDLVAVEKAAKVIAASEIVYGFGAGGNSSMIVNELQNRLFRLGIRIQASNDHAMNLMLAAAAQNGTVVFGSSISGRNAELVRCIELLRDREIPTIALTQPESPVAQAADIVIPISLPEGANIYRPTSTRYAYLAVIDILANLVAYQNRENSAAILRDIKEQLVRHRDGDDRQLLGD